MEESGSVSREYALSCCSTVDLLREHLEAIGVEWVPFHYSLDGVEYLDDMGQSLSPERFYSALAHGAEPKTAQVSVDQYRRHFSRLLERTPKVLHVCLSSGLTGTMDSALIAAQMVMSEQPGASIVVVDSLCASSGYGLLMDTLAAKRDAGASFEEACDWVESHKLRVHHWFFSTDLSFYVKGGRISKAAGVVGTALHICPLLDMDHLGRLTPREKIRSERKTMRRALTMMIEHAEGGTGYAGKAFICHSACMAEAEALASMVTEAFSSLAEPVSIFPIGTTIGSHTGPGTISLFFWGDERVD